MLAGDVMSLVRSLCSAGGFCVRACVLSCEECVMKNGENASIYAMCLHSDEPPC